jgi:hypothetical protein
MLDHPDQAKEWNNNYIVCLSASDENQLGNLLDKLGMHDIRASSFLEPDIGYELTAIAFQGTDKASKLTSHLPLALNNFK